MILVNNFIGQKESLSGENCICNVLMEKKKCIPITCSVKVNKKIVFYVLMPVVL